MKRTVIRIALVACVFLVSLWLYNIGKGHDLLLDNKTMEIGGTKFKALETVEVSVDGGEAIELYRRDRDKVLVTNSSHTITVNVLNDDGEPEQTITKKFKVSNYHGMYLLNIPALVAGNEGWVMEFPLKK